MPTEAPHRLLLIEDDARLRATLAELLRQSGFEVDEAEEGEEGLRLHRRQPADLVITDLIMPGREGMETILELKRIEPEIKIIAMSGGGRVRAAEYLPVAEAAGADRVLEKPFGIERLLELIRELLAAD
jgi:DNA-binding response OmpR family regulator